MTTYFYITITIIIGICLSAQPAINALSARTLGSPFLAAIISIGITLISAIAVWLIWERDTSSVSNIKALPWWIIVGGIIGLLFVAGGIVLVPIIGVALFFVCIVGGQLIGASIADHIGAFGMEIKTISLSKIIGLLLVILGAVLVQRG